MLNKSFIIDRNSILTQSDYINYVPGDLEYDYFSPKEINVARKVVDVTYLLRNAQSDAEVLDIVKDEVFGIIIHEDDDVPF